MNKEEITKTIQEIKSYLDTLEEMEGYMFREPRFSCVSDSLLTFEVAWANNKHLFTVGGLDCFCDGMTLTEMLQPDRLDYIDYTHWDERTIVVKDI